MKRPRVRKRVRITRKKRMEQADIARKMKSIEMGWRMRWAGIVLSIVAGVGLWAYAVYDFTRTL